MTAGVDGPSASDGDAPAAGRLDPLRDAGRRTGHPRGRAGRLQRSRRGRDRRPDPRRCAGRLAVAGRGRRRRPDRRPSPDDPLSRRGRRWRHGGDGAGDRAGRRGPGGPAAGRRERAHGRRDQPRGRPRRAGPRAARPPVVLPALRLRIRRAAPASSRPPPPGPTPPGWPACCPPGPTTCAGPFATTRRSSRSPKASGVIDAPCASRAGIRPRPLTSLVSSAYCPRQARSGEGPGRCPALAPGGTSAPWRCGEGWRRSVRGGFRIRGPGGERRCPPAIAGHQARAEAVPRLRCELRPGVQLHLGVDRHVHATRRSRSVSAGRRSSGRGRS